LVQAKNLRHNIASTSAPILLESGAMELLLRPSMGERFDWLVDWLYPPRCRACAERFFGRDAEYFCTGCRAKIQLVGHPMCNVCGRPFPDASGDDHTCGVCLARPPQFVRAWAWACYPSRETEDHPLRQAVHKFKYGRKVSLGKPLGRLMARGCGEFLRDCNADVIVPVPLHPKRLRWRGFNQAVLLARQMSGAYGIAADPFVLRRIKETPPQTQLNEEERRRNVRGAFALAEGRSLRGKTVLLTDDVYTSGATVNECSRTLKRSGVDRVFVVTLARAI
jgi:ComF family protein